MTVRLWILTDSTLNGVIPALFHVAHWPKLAKQEKQHFEFSVKFKIVAIATIVYFCPHTTNPLSLAHLLGEVACRVCMCILVAMAPVMSSMTSQMHLIQIIWIQCTNKKATDEILAGIETRLARFCCYIYFKDINLSLEQDEFSPIHNLQGPSTDQNGWNWFFGHFFNFQGPTLKIVSGTHPENHHLIWNLSFPV